MKQCVKCFKTYKISSRHSLCNSCRKAMYRITCPSCGLMMQRKSKVCKSCYFESKQYPNSKKKHLSKDGYYYVYFRKHPYSDKSGRVFEHRIVMEQKLGRYLFSFENVHHLNGIRTDNRIENLELWIKAQPSGARVQDVVKWAKQIVKIYGDVSSAGLER